MKTQIKLKLREFAIDNLSSGLSDRNFREDRIKDLYSGVKTEMNKYYWVDEKHQNQQLTFLVLYNFLGKEDLIDMICESSGSDSTKKKSFETIWYLSIALGYPIEKVELFHDKFKEYNLKTKVGERPTPSIMSDELFESYRNMMEKGVERLNASVPLTSESHISLVVRYRDTLLKILLIEFPTRSASDYFSLKNSDDGKNGYYGDGKINYRLSNTKVTINIPEKYLTLFDRYHRVAEGLSEYFFFGEKNKEQIDGKNFTSYLKKLFGMNLSGFKHKWGEIMKKKMGTVDYIIFQGMAETD